MYCIYDPSLLPVSETSFAVLQVWFGSQNYTVTEGDAVNITFITNSSNYDFDFFIILQPTDGSAIGEYFY